MTAPRLTAKFGAYSVPISKPLRTFEKGKRTHWFNELNELACALLNPTCDLDIHSEELNNLSQTLNSSLPFQELRTELFRLKIQLAYLNCANEIFSEMRIRSQEQKFSPDVVTQKGGWDEFIKGNLNKNYLNRVLDLETRICQLELELSEQEDQVFSITYEKWAINARKELFAETTLNLNTYFLMAKTLIENSSNDNSFEFIDKEFKQSGNIDLDSLSMDLSRKKCAKAFLDYLLLQIKEKLEEKDDDSNRLDKIHFTNLKKECSELLVLCQQEIQMLIKKSLAKQKEERKKAGKLISPSASQAAHTLEKNPFPLKDRETRSLSGSNAPFFPSRPKVITTAEEERAELQRLLEEERNKPQKPSNLAPVTKRTAGSGNLDKKPLPSINSRTEAGELQRTGNAQSTISQSVATSTLGPVKGVKKQRPPTAGKARVSLYNSGEGTKPNPSGSSGSLPTP